MKRIAYKALLRLFRSQKWRKYTVILPLHVFSHFYI